MSTRKGRVAKSRTAKPKADPKPKLRLISVTLRPEFVLDDGKTLTPVETEAAKVPAAEWPDFPKKGFEQARRALEKELSDADQPR